MGAEQSLHRKWTTTNTGKDGSYADQNTLSANHESVECLSDEFKQFLKEKQQEFNTLVVERNRLRIDLEANDLAYKSIMEAYSQQLNKFENQHEECLADIISWKSIALGADAVLMSKQEQIVVDSEK